MEKWTVEKIKNLEYDDILKLNEKELRKALNTAVSAANKRIKRLEESGVSSGALENLKSNRTQQYFSSKDKDYKQLRAELMRARNFLRAKSSTLRGAKKIEKEIGKRINFDYSSMNKKQKNTFWESYNEIKKMYPNLAYQDSEKLQREVVKMYRKNTNIKTDDLISKTSDYILKKYYGTTEDDILSAYF